MKIDVRRDAEFICELLNYADFLEYIGDRGVRTVADAELLSRTSRYRRVMAKMALAMYVVELKAIGTSRSGLAVL